MKTDPGEWFRRNHEVMHALELEANLRIHRLLEMRSDEIIGSLLRHLDSPEGRKRVPHAGDLSTHESHWHASQSLRHLISSVRTREKGVFMAYCRDLAQHCIELGFDAGEICYELEVLGGICVDLLRKSGDPGVTEADLRAYVTMTIEFGVDQVQEICELAEMDALGEMPERYRDHLWSYRQWDEESPPYKKGDLKTLVATRTTVVPTR